MVLDIKTSQISVRTRISDLNKKIRDTNINSNNNSNNSREKKQMDVLIVNCSRAQSVKNNEVVPSKSDSTGNINDHPLNIVSSLEVEDHEETINNSTEFAIKTDHCRLSFPSSLSSQLLHGDSRHQIVGSSDIATALCAIPSSDPQDALLLPHDRKRGEKDSSQRMDSLNCARESFRSPHLLSIDPPVKSPPPSADSAHSGRNSLRSSISDCSSSVFLLLVLLLAKLSAQIPSIELDALTSSAIS
jgi:hypothetical protein